jgi:hypothetical protein
MFLLLAALPEILRGKKEGRKEGRKKERKKERKNPSCF